MLALTQGMMTLAAGGGGGGSDPDFASVTSLIHFEGADGSTTLTDTITRTWTRFGNAQITTGQSLFGASSGLFDGNGDYWQSDDTSMFNISANQDFTVEFAIRLNSLTRRIFLGAEGGSIYYFDFNRTGTGAMSWAGNIILTSTTVMGTGVWYRVAVTRAGTSWRIFIDGNLESTETASSSSLGGNTVLQIGACPGIGGASLGLDGWLDEFRLTKGVARYTASYTPATGAFPDS